MSKYTRRDNLEVSKKRWAAYVAAGAAATLAGTQTAEADITHVVVGGTDGAITNLDRANRQRHVNDGASRYDRTRGRSCRSTGLSALKR